MSAQYRNSYRQFDIYEDESSEEEKFLEESSDEEYLEVFENDDLPETDEGDVRISRPENFSFSPLFWGRTCTNNNKSLASMIEVFK